MVKENLYLRSRLIESERCCAALGNNHRCSRSNDASGDDLICHNHAEKLRAGEWVRLYKQSEFEATDLGEAFGSLRDRLRAVASHSNNALTKKEKTTLAAALETPSSQENASSSWFSKLLSPQALGMVLFLTVVYVAEMVKLWGINAPSSLALSGAEGLSLAIGNTLSVLVFVTLTVIWFGVLVSLVAFVVFATRRIYEILRFWRQNSVPSLLSRFVSRSRFFFLMAGVKAVAALPEKYQPSKFDKARSIDTARDNRDRTVNQIRQAFEARERLLLAEGANWRNTVRTVIAGAARWYHDRLLVREKNSPAVNRVQAASIISLFCITLMGSWFGAAQFNQALNNNICATNATEQSATEHLSSWLNLPLASYSLLNPHISAVDCGYLVFDSRRENLSSLLNSGNKGPDDETTQRLYSEQVAYLGDYGEWSLVVPASTPSERVLIRRSAIQEFARSEPVNGLWRQKTPSNLEDHSPVTPLASILLVFPQENGGDRGDDTGPRLDALAPRVRSSISFKGPFEDSSPEMVQVENLLTMVEMLNLTIGTTVDDLETLVEMLHEPIIIDVQPRLIPAETLDASEVRNLLFPGGTEPIGLQTRLELDDEPFATADAELAAALNGANDKTRLPILSRLTLDGEPFEGPQQNLTELLNTPGEASPLRLSAQLQIDNVAVEAKSLAQDALHIGSLHANLTIGDVTGLRGAFESALSEPFRMMLNQTSLSAPESCQQFETSVHFRLGSYDMLEAPHTNNNLEVLSEFVNRVEGGDLVILRGHTDPTGPASVNLDLAEKRAENVREVLLRNFPETSTQFSFTPVGAQISELFWAQQGTAFPIAIDGQMRRVDLYHCSLPASDAYNHGR